MPLLRRTLSALLSLSLLLSTTGASATSYYEILVKRQRAAAGAAQVRAEQPRFVKVGTKISSRARLQQLRRDETTAGDMARKECLGEKKATSSDFGALPDGFLACYKEKKAAYYKELSTKSALGNTNYVDPIITERAKAQRENQLQK